ncbi:MAG: ATP-binding protein [Solirubrobacteraceae bacterium]
MDQTPEQTLSLDLPCDRSAPGAIRDAIGRMGGMDGLAGDVALVAGELVTNAVLHSGGSSQDMVEVTVFVEPGRVRVSVHDPGRSGQSAQPRHFADDAIGGWGLQIVDRIALRWGAERSEGYRVWAEMATD